MQEFLNKLIPHVMERLPVFYQSIIDTLIMVGWSGSISFFLGLILGITIIVTKKNGILENAVVFQVFDKIINFFRSIPFVILLAGLISVSRFVMGTAIGIKGAIVPLIFGTVPFFSRQIESALAEVNPGLIEAAQSMGSSPAAIIFRVYLKESVAAIVRATTITIISLIGLTAMAGAIGAGGLGDFAIRFGHQRNWPDATYVTVLTVFIIVSIIQGIGSLIVKKTTH